MVELGHGGGRCQFQRWRREVARVADVVDGASDLRIDDVEVRAKRLSRM